MAVNDIAVQQSCVLGDNISPEFSATQSGLFIYIIEENMDSTMSNTSIKDSTGIIYRNKDARSADLVLRVYYY